MQTIIFTNHRNNSYIGRQLLYIRQLLPIRMAAIRTPAVVAQPNRMKRPTVPIFPNDRHDPIGVLNIHIQDIVFCHHGIASGGLVIDIASPIVLHPALNVFRHIA